ncbi:DddA-like double-stranded DNA deaminase toxin [Lentzea sp. BCCO 10_0798]|uniref:DddA-like double-stranded DNA deaminase toxin n=1 Tax=Lentzea kristufekii TaxID=3095430 RepID=A0ABU4TYN6_9PSEU|nr:DddA-like double-stranded DNA deaminase toxin [Lentzea sp. BCCO 10_0798]MDX8053425.1 DddA-like double-stranded DNA deaminase toxin [Lentzea sp. BCCO 10_0798]
MVSLSEIGESLNRVLDKAAEAGAALRTAAELAEAARDLLETAAEGSLQADVEVTNAQFSEAAEGIAELHRHLGAAVDGTQKILHGLERGRRAEAPRPAAPPSPVDAIPLPQPSVRERVDRLRRALPPPVQPRSGQKTHGRWFTDSDEPGTPERELASGHDEWMLAAKQHLRDMGMPGTPVTAVDVEIKIAVHMARNGIRHATVVLNNTPCKGRFGCDTLVPAVLPEGSSLTVHGVTPDGRIMQKTYTGGAAAPWS